jgi:hypothetical protein
MARKEVEGKDEADAGNLHATVSFVHGGLP